MKTGDLNLKQVTTSLTDFMHRYHVIIFVLTVIGGLAFATFMMNQAINQQPAGQATPSSATAVFDTETMDKIDKLNNSSSQPTEFTPPAGRLNPFLVE